MGEDQAVALLDRFRRMAGRLILLDRKLALLESEGWPSDTGFDKPSSRGTSENTPTEAAAMARIDARDPAVKARKRLQSMIRRLEHQVQKHLDQERWVEGGDTVEAPDVFCSSCERVTMPNGQTIAEPRYRGDLCRRCYDWTRAHNGVLPPGGLCWEWQKGTRMTPEVVSEYEAVAKREGRQAARRRIT